MIILKRLWCRLFGHCKVLILQGRYVSELPDLQKEEIELGVQSTAVAEDIARLEAEIAAITVDDEGLRVGRYRLEAAYLGEVVPHSAGATRDRLGRDADRRALLVVRGYIPTSVEVAIADPADPHPYWLISTRRPDELAAALTELRDRMPR